MQIEKERFEAWLFSQPRNKEFYFMCTECMIGEFIKSETGNYPFATGFHCFTLSTGDRTVFPNWLDKLQFAYRLGCGAIQRFTYGQVQDTYIKLFGPVPMDSVEPLTSTQGQPEQPLSKN